MINNKAYVITFKEIIARGHTFEPVNITAANMEEAQIRAKQEIDSRVFAFPVYFVIEDAHKDNPQINNV